jgi:hypothetical protein
LSDIIKGLSFEPFDVRADFAGGTEVRPGDVLRLKSGEVYLVGGVNDLLGVCDDCVGFPREAVAEYARLIDCT